MRCEHCHGGGKEPRKDSNGTSRYTDEPCSVCGGCGIAHCCDGICEQPPYIADTAKPEAIVSPYNNFRGIGYTESADDWRRRMMQELSTP